MNILIIAGDGIGGTEKAAFLFGSELARRGYRVIAQASEGKPRVAEFLAAGGKVDSFAYTAQSIEATISKHEIHLIHQHVSGYGDHRELYTALDHMGANRPKLIETNVFGHLLDFHDQGHVDFRMFISLTSGLQSFRRTRIKGFKPDPQHDSVLFYPFDPQDVSSGETTNEDFRKELGVEKDECLVIRIGRPGHKWTHWECESFSKAHKFNPKLRMLLMEPDQPICDAISRGIYGEGIIVKEATSDQTYLRKVYCAGDLMLHASSFGESFGYTVAEAMASKLPLITRATPWGDNAQTELVVHNETGYICGSVDGMSKALVELASNEATRVRMGEAGRHRILAMTSLKHETDVLEEILRFVMNGQQGSLMPRRFSAWEEYSRYGYLLASRKRYEADHRLLLSLLAGKLYETARCIKSVKRYFKLKSQGRPVAFPLIFRS